MRTIVSALIRTVAFRETRQLPSMTAANLIAFSCAFAVVAANARRTQLLKKRMPKTECTRACTPEKGAWMGRGWLLGSVALVGCVSLHRGGDRQTPDHF